METATKGSSMTEQRERVEALIQPGAVLRIPKTYRTMTNVRVVRRDTLDIPGLKGIYFTGERISRDSKALAASGFTKHGPVKAFSLMPGDLERVGIATDGAILRAAARMTEREAVAA